MILHYLREVEALPENWGELLLADDEVAVGDGVAEAVLGDQAVQSSAKAFLPGSGNGWLKCCATVQFSPQNGGAFAVYKSVFSREGRPNRLGLPEKVFGGKIQMSLSA